MGIWEMKFCILKARLSVNDPPRYSPAWGGGWSVVVLPTEHMLRASRRESSEKDT